MVSLSNHRELNASTRLAAGLPRGQSAKAAGAQKYKKAAGPEADQDAPEEDPRKVAGLAPRRDQTLCPA